jgi:hypothetical protein
MKIATAADVKFIGCGSCPGSTAVNANSGRATSDSAAANEIPCANGEESGRAATQR